MRSITLQRLPRLESCRHLMLEGGRRQLPGSFLPLFSWLCSLSSDKVAGRTSSSISDREDLPYRTSWASLEPLQHGHANEPLPLCFSSASLPPPRPGLPPKGLCTSCSPSFSTLPFLPLPPIPLCFPQCPELGAQHRSGGRDGCAHLLHIWQGNHQKLVASILSQTRQFLFSWMPMNFSGKEKVFFCWGIRFQTQRQTDSAQCKVLSIGSCIFLQLWL